MESAEALDAPEAAHDALREDPTLAQDMRALVADARRFAEAELAYQKARAAYVGGAARSIAVLGIVAAVLLFFVVMAAIMGTVIALGPVLGLWGAMAAVTLTLLAVAAICALAALMKVRRMKAVLAEGNADGQPG